MHTKIHSAILTLALAALAACQAAPPRADLEPKPDEMRDALLTLMNQRPDISTPEFKIALETERPVTLDGIVYIGAWNCDPKLQTFIALLTAPNITMYEVSGRFQLDARGVWVAIPRRVVKTTKHDVGEFWRPNEVDAR